jgi:hypothetical protein
VSGDNPPTITVRLDYNERSFLVMVADRGGEIRFNWARVGQDARDPAATRKVVRKRIDQLIGKGCLNETAIVGAGTEVWLRLTNTGRNLVDFIKQGAPSVPPR